MRYVIVLLTFGVAIAASASDVRAPVATTYPDVAALLRSPDGVFFTHSCGGAILNNRSVLTAARCLENDTPARWRIRVGSINWASGGLLYSVTQIIMAGFDPWSMMNDIAIVRASSNIVFGSSVSAGRFAGAFYVLPDNQSLDIVGWGSTNFPLWDGNQYAQLHRTDLANININTCRNLYSAQGFYIQNSMLCSGFTSPDSVNSAQVQSKCFGEPGAPVYHYGVIVGVRSFAVSCTTAAIPSVNTRVSNFMNWIQSNA